MSHNEKQAARSLSTLMEVIFYVVRFESKNIRDYVKLKTYCFYCAPLGITERMALHKQLLRHLLYSSRYFFA